MIESKNLIFRELEEHDVSEEYVSWLNDKEINQFLQVKHEKQSLESTKEYVRTLRPSKYNFLFGIFDKNSKKHIGNIRLTITHPIEEVANIGILIGNKDFQNKGYAQESINKITQYGLKELNLKRIEAGFYSVNKKGLNSFLKCGYSIDGYLKSYWIHNNKRVGRILASILND